MEFENFIKELNINDENLKKLQDYFLFTEKDKKILRDFKKKIKHIPEEIFDDFYNHLLSFPETKEILTREKGLIERLKKYQREYLEFLLNTDININYIKRAFMVGKKHWEYKVRIDYYQGAYLKYIDAILSYYERKFTSKELLKIRNSFLKLIFIDMNIVIKTYYFLLNRELEEERKKYETIFESSFDGIIVVDENGKIIDVNPRVEEMTSLKKEEILLKDFKILMPKKDEKYLNKLFLEALRSNNKFDIYYDLYLYNYKEKREIPVEIAVSKIKVEEKTIFITSIRNVEDRLEKERKIASLSRLYKILYKTNALLTRVSDIDTLFENVIDILTEEGRFENIVFVKLENDDIKVVKRYKDISFTEDQKEAIRASIKEKKIIKFDDDFFISLPILLDKYVFTEVDFKDNKYALILSSSDIRYLSKDEKLLLKQIVYDIAFTIYSIKKKEEVKYLSYYDLMTNLPNRKFFIEELENALKESKEREEKISLILIDIDRFKHINEVFGFSIGDLVLKSLAENIKEILRKRDLIARIGSDEFGIIAFGIKSTHDIMRIISRIEEVVKTPIRVDNQTIFTTLSIGISVFPDDGSSLSEIFAAANAALREAKNKGGNNVVFYNPEMKKIAEETIKLEIELRKAISEGQFILYYQPIVDLKSLKIIGAEALLRWKHPEKGIIPPNRFISLLEDSNMILEVGEWIIEEVIKQSIKWERYNLQIAISLNISAKQLISTSISDMIKRKLIEIGGSPERIIIEITESTMMENLELVKIEIEKLHKMGIKVEIDDFGTGYSSLAYLKKLPVSTLKIDKEFVKDLILNEDDKIITKAIINLAHVLHKNVIAEGIETKEQLEFLINEGCDYGQGYLFSPPVSPEKFEQIYHNFKINFKIS